MAMDPFRSSGAGTANFMFSPRSRGQPVPKAHNRSFCARSHRRARISLGGRTMTAPSDRGAELIQRARELAPRLVTRAEKTAEERRISDQTIADFHQAGFF